MASSGGVVAYCTTPCSKSDGTWRPARPIAGTASPMRRTPTACKARINGSPTLTGPFILPSGRPAAGNTAGAVLRGRRASAAALEWAPSTRMRASFALVAREARAPARLWTSRPMRWRRLPPGQRLTLAMPVGLVVLLLGCAAQPPAADTGATAGSPPSSEWFVDRASDAGLDFVHVNGMSGSLSLPEIMGPGVALFDYDNDGDLDAYAVQGGTLTARGAGASSPASTGDRLYRNDLQPGPGGTRFTDVTARSGIDVRSYGMGVAAADVDNDGWVDVYLNRLGADVLLHNNGNGTFTDVTRQSGIADDAWSVSAS